MPYELDYKKVHNTLKSETLKNHYGCTKGKIPNLLGQYELKDNKWDFVAQKLLLKNNQYLVIQNNTNATLTPSIVVFTEDNQNVTVTPSSLSINANSSKMIELPINTPVIQTTEKIPYQIELRFSNIRQDDIITKQVSIWETESDILGYEDDNLIIRTERPTEIISITVNVLDWSTINAYLDRIDFNLNSSTSSGGANIDFIFPKDEDHILSILIENNLNLVIVPVKAKTRKPLKSITNMRNIKQVDLYDDQYRKVSLYLEPIKLHITPSEIATQETTVNFTFTVPSFPIDRDYFKEVQSKRGYTTYGLYSNNYNTSWALAVCRGCGYDEGRNGGVTKIKLALGLQLNKSESENPHSGCNLSYFKVLGDDNDIINLNRLALTRNDNNDCIIELIPQNEEE